MALERKKSDCSHNVSECLLQKRNSKHSLVSRTCGCDDLEKLRFELEMETQIRFYLLGQSINLLTLIISEMMLRKNTLI